MYSSVRSVAILGALLLFGAGLADAGPIPIPTGLQPGDQFRLVFVSSVGMNATSSVIGNYDTFVENLASNAGLGSYDGKAVHWYALASAGTVSAIDRLNDFSVPIYTMVGSLVADASHPLWAVPPANFSGPISPINYDESSNVLNTGVWTGTLNAGYMYLPLGSLYSAYGVSNETYHFWLTAGSGLNDHMYSLYGYSDVITVASVPEPASLLLFGTGLVGMITTARRRMRR